MQSDFKWSITIICISTETKIEPVAIVLVYEKMSNVFCALKTKIFEKIVALSFVVVVVVSVIFLSMLHNYKIYNFFFDGLKRVWHIVKIYIFGSVLIGNIFNVCITFGGIMYSFHFDVLSFLLCTSE